MRIKVYKNGHPLTLDERITIRHAFRQDVYTLPFYFQKHLSDFAKFEGNELWLGCTKEGAYTYSEDMTIGE